MRMFYNDRFIRHNPKQDLVNKCNLIHQTLSLFGTKENIIS